MIALVTGFVLGFLTSMGVGPVNITAMSKALRQGFAHGFSVGLGAAAMDLVYAAVGVFGLSPLVDYEPVRMAFKVISIPLLIYLGVKALQHRFESSPYTSQNARNNGRKHSSFLMGLFLYVANPTFLPFWIGVAGIVHSHKLVQTTLVDNSLFSVGVGIGTAIWFYVLLRFICMKHIQLKPALLNAISKVSGVLLIVFGCYLGYKFVVTDISRFL